MKTDKNGTHPRQQILRKAKLSIIALGLAVTSIVPARVTNSQGPGGDWRIHLPFLQKPLTMLAAAGSVVFVSRQINADGSIYWDSASVRDMPGVGPHSRVRPAAPGKLILRDPSGTLRVLIDGSKPTPASMNLIDVNAPDVSYDGTTIVFAGLPNGNHPASTASNTDAWRIYTISIDGTNLRQVTDSDQQLNLRAAGLPGTIAGYDDFDPVWLPDGRIVFSSTRYPSFAHYSGVRTSNLHVVKADGTEMMRITTERNGADRPMVDPITGKIVFSRWWRNHRFAVDDMTTIGNETSGYSQKDGLSANRTNQMDGTSEYADHLWRNAWHLTSINPDGTGLQKWSTTLHEEENHSYGGTFRDDGSFVGNYFPMYNMTEAGGFGGLRIYPRGGSGYTPFMGITTLSRDYANTNPSPSFGIFKGEYVSEPAALANGRLLVSIAKDVGQDYGIYIVNSDGSGRTLVYDNPGTSELRAKPVGPRRVPTVINPVITQVPSLLPPPAAGPYDQDGVFTFDAVNIYANGPIDSDIVDAPPVGSGATIRFFADFQRASAGSFPGIDWPILLAEMPIGADGSVINRSAPANVPLFEQVRDANGRVPLTRDPMGTNGAAHVTGLNYGRPGESVKCVGCHTGHSMMPVPSNRADALFSNLAPGAAVTVSSARDQKFIRGVIDRRVNRGEIWRSWTSANGQATNQWVKLDFLVPVTVRTVRLYNPRQGDEANSSLQVQSARVTLYSDAAGTVPVGTQTTGALSVNGTDVSFNDVMVRSVRVEILSTTGTFYGARVASLAEIEVIARGEAP